VEPVPPDAEASADLYLSVLTVGEIAKGIALLATGKIDPWQDSKKHTKHSGSHFDGKSIKTLFVLKIMTGRASHPLTRADDDFIRSEA
jgi:hypothetical protein